MSMAMAPVQERGKVWEAVAREQRVGTRRVERERAPRATQWENVSRTAPVELIREGDIHWGTHEVITARRLVFGHVLVRTQFHDWMDLGPAGEARCLIDTMILSGEYDPIYDATH